MPDFRETRVPVDRWKEILIPTYDELLKLGAGDVWVYGSQAMSLYMKRALASGELDLLTSGMTMSIVKKLCKALEPFSSQKNPYFSYQNPGHDGKPNPVFSV